MTTSIDQVRYWSGGVGLTKISILSVLRMQGFDPHVWFGHNGDVDHLDPLPYQRVIWVAEGMIIVRLSKQGQEFRLQQGDRLDLPAGISHTTVICSERLICVEARRYVPGRRHNTDLSTKELSGK